MSSNELKAGVLSIGGNETFHVSGNRVLIECESDTDTYGNTGLIKPEDYKRYSRWGWIRQIGEGVKLDYKSVLLHNKDYEIIIGDKVCYDAYTGQDIEFNGKDYKIVSPENLLCKVEL